MKFVGLTETYKKRLREIYKGVDIDAELSKMCLWLASPKGLNRTGEVGFILKWLNNALERIPVTNNEITIPISHIFDDYLKDLWKNAEHILELNTIPA